MLFNVHRDGQVIETDLPTLFEAKLFAQERDVNGDRIEQIVDGVVVKAWDLTPCWGWVVDPQYMELIEEDNIREHEWRAQSNDEHPPF